MRAMMLIALSAWSAWAAPSLWAAEPALVSDPSVVADAPSEALQAFGRWAARQELYSRSMIVDMRQRLRDKLASLAPDEAAQLRDDVLDKLSILSDPQLQDAEQWLAETLVMASDAYASQILARLPDIVDDSTGEVRVKLRTLIVR